jgi:hypothetical protein
MSHFDEGKPRPSIMSDVNVTSGRKDAGSCSNVEKGDEKVSKGTDVGVTVLNGTIDELNVADSEARRVLRKIDLRLLPVLAITYMIQVRKFGTLQYDLVLLTWISQVLG